MASLRPPSRRALPVLAALAGLVGVTACSPPFSGTPESSAELSIEAKLESDFGFADVDATCQPPADENPGTTFQCTAATDLGDVVWMATLGEENTVDVQPVNLLDGGRVAGLEATAAQLLSDEVGMTVSVEAVDCGEVMVLDAANSAPCSVVDPASGRTYDAVLTIDDAATNAFTVAVAAQPRV